MKQLDGGQKYFRMWCYTEKAAKKLEEEGFLTGYYDYKVSDWLKEMQDLVLKAWAKDTPDGPLETIEGERDVHEPQTMDG